MKTLLRARWLVDRAYHIVLLGLLGLSIFGCAAFCRYHLIETTEQFAKEFRRQNLNELESSDVLSLTTRLNALSRSLNYVCIVAEHKDVTFLAKTKREPCEEKAFWEKGVTVQSPTNPELRIGFVLRLPPRMEWAVMAFAAVQLVLMGLVMWGARGVERLKHSLTEKLATLAAQVAHDIRSPLSALLALSNSADRLPENDRILFRKAIARIQDIANNLVEHRRSLLAEEEGEASPPKAETELPAMKASVQHLGTMVRSMISEKKAQFADRHGVAIELADPEAAYETFASVDPREFKRVVSNLINNAVEAIEDTGKVSVSLTSAPQQVTLMVKDNGKGIPGDILPKLTRKKLTFGKEGGSGLGLCHAGKVVRALGGDIAIRSEQHRGTEVTITLPRAAPPRWFVSRIVLREGQTVVVLDDEPSVHGVWAKRFESLKDQGHRIELRQFEAYPDLKEWAEATPGFRRALFLVDYEFMGEERNGLDIIAELKINEQAILVTANFEQEKVRQGCLDAGVKLLPKEFVHSTAIAVQEGPKKVDAVLIDDDPLVELTWRRRAKELGKSLLYFPSVGEFLGEAENVSAKSPVYIDSDLGTKERGEEEAEHIFARGFEEIYLVTGTPAEQVAPNKWIRKVLGKVPPWNRD